MIKRGQKWTKQLFLRKQLFSAFKESFKIISAKITEHWGKNGKSKQKWIKQLFLQKYPFNTFKEGFKVVSAKTAEYIR